MKKNKHSDKVCNVSEDRCFANNFTTLSEQFVDAMTGCYVPEHRKRCLTLLKTAIRIREKYGEYGLVRLTAAAAFVLQLSDKELERLRKSKK